MWMDLYMSEDMTELLAYLISNPFIINTLICSYPHYRVLLFCK